MPAIPSVTSFLEDALVRRDTLALSSNVTAAATHKALEVVCAWPVSGQYGPGTRALYYVLIAACVVARKVEVIRNACLAAVLLFPAVAALHAIVLAVLHVDGAVDMDIYGAFQLCAIGILTAPATVRLSQTYFMNPGRDIIFIWTVLLLAGLLSLIVEFMRLEAITCPSHLPESVAWANGEGFQYGAFCGLKCSPDDGPTSSLREGSTDNIYVIPVPTQLSFNTTTLLAAACCIPAILSLVSMWIKILDHNWEKFSKNKAKPDDAVIEGTNGATISHMTGIGEKIKKGMSLIEVPVMAGAVLAILIQGEKNFWSGQVYYQTEPITSIGQWAPIVGTGLAVLGSLYLLLSADMEAEGKGNTVVKCPGPGCTDCELSNNQDGFRRESETSGEGEGTVSEIEMITTRTATMHTHNTNTTQNKEDLGGRRKVARLLNWASDALTTKAHQQIENGGFKPDQRLAYPETPGENHKNPNLSEQKAKYTRSSTPAPSFVSSRGSLDNGEGPSNRARSRTRRGESFPIPRPPPATTHRSRSHAGSLPGVGLLDPHSPHCPSTPGTPSGGWSQQLRPFGITTPNRSRANSASDVSPTTTSPASYSFPPSTPTIIISRDESG